MLKPTPLEFGAGWHRWGTRAKRASAGRAGVVTMLLAAHYEFPGHLATAKHLAKSIDREEHWVVHLQYGRPASLLRAALAYNGAGKKSSVIASFWVPGPRGNEEWLWRINPQLADALVEAGWVTNPRSQAVRPASSAGD